jgi:hypothetical protein
MSKLIARGLKGCILKPALPCPNGDPNNGYITKIFKKGYYDTEYKKAIINKLKQIDPNEDYVIRPVPVDEKCGPDEEAKIDIPSELINNCGPLLDNESGSGGFGVNPITRQDIRILYQKNAGDKTLSQAIFEDMESQGLVQSSPIPGRLPSLKRGKPAYKPSEQIETYMSTVMDIHDFLFDNNLYHGDIGFNNVMIGLDGKVRFIDTDGLNVMTANEKAEVEHTDEVKAMAAREKTEVVDLVHDNLRKSGISQLNGSYQPFSLSGFKYTRDDKFYDLFGGKKKTIKRRKNKSLKGKRIRKTLKKNK